jgi:hypothetical protein
MFVFFNIFLYDNNKLSTSNVYPGRYQVVVIEFIAEVMEKENDFLKQYKAQELSITAYAVAKLFIMTSGKPSFTSEVNARIKQSALSINQLVAQEVIGRKASGFHAQELCNTVYAFATIRSKDSILIQEATQIIVVNALRIIRQLNGQSASTLVWAVAQICEGKTYAIKQLLHSIANRFIDISFVAKPQDISMTLCGFIQLEYVDYIQYRAIADRLHFQNASLYNGQDIATIVSALAKASILVRDNVIPNTTLVSQSILNSKKNHHSFARDPVVLKLWAIAAQELRKRPNDFNSQEFFFIRWGFHTLGLNIQRIQNNDMPIFSKQDTANII